MILILNRILITRCFELDVEHFNFQFSIEIYTADIRLNNLIGFSFNSNAVNNLLCVW